MIFDREIFLKDFEWKYFVFSLSGQWVYEEIDGIIYIDFFFEG